MSSHLVCRIQYLCHSFDFRFEFPTSAQEYLQVANKFFKQWNFPHCLGSIDGKHVAIQKPIGSGSEYYNYKGFYSVVLLALVDAEYNFLYISIGTKDV